MVSHKRVEEMLQEEIKKAKAIGILVEPINPKVRFPKAQSFYGMCHRETTKENGKIYYYYIRISEYYLGASEEEIHGTLMHEVLHACKETRDCGHGKEWKELAARVNKAYGYEIKRCGSQIKGSKDYDLKVNAPAACKTKGHLVVCKKCGAEFKRTRHSRMTLHPDWYRCRCGGDLELKY